MPIQSLHSTRPSGATFLTTPIHPSCRRSSAWRASTLDPSLIVRPPCYLMASCACDLLPSAAPHLALNFHTALSCARHAHLSSSSLPRPRSLASQSAYPRSPLLPACSPGPTNSSLRSSLRRQPRQMFRRLKSRRLLHMAAHSRSVRYCPSFDDHAPMPPSHAAAALPSST